MTKLLECLIMAFVLALCVTALVSVITTGHLPSLDELWCLLKLGNASVCLSAMLMPSFYFQHGRLAIPNVDYNPDADICQDDYEYYTSSGKYADSLSCPICGVTLTHDSEYAYGVMPNGDTWLVCSDHVCPHGKIIPTLFDNGQLDHIHKTIEVNTTLGDYLSHAAQALYSVLWDYRNPCYTCYTTY